MFRKRLPFENRQINRTTLIISGLLAFMLGLWMGKYDLNLPAWVLVLPIATIPLAFSKKPRAVIFVIMFGLSLGIIRGEYVLQQTKIYQDLEGEKITLVGKVNQDTSYDERGQTDFYVTNAMSDGISLPGKIRVRGYSKPDGVERGDIVRVNGKVYDGFGSYQASISYASIDVIERDDGVISNMRKTFFAGIYTALPEPQASLGLGFLVGLRALLPEDLLNQLSRTGLTHIVAVSGYNLTVLVRLSRRWGMKISKFSATAISVGLIIFFLAITGLAPSIFRASIVAGFALLAWYYGRPIKPLMLLALSGAVTAGISPYFIWSDIGWWLSFTAFFGVLILAPVFTQKLFKKDGSELSAPLQIAIETICAQIMALPIIMAIFGELSLISIFANILVVPFIPLAMALSFVAGIGGVFFTQVAGWIALPAEILLTAMTSVVALLSDVSWALVEVKIDWPVVLAWYLVVLLIYFAAKRGLSTNQKQHVAHVNYLE